MIQYCTFHVDNLFLGVDVLRVQEILRQQEMTPVPLAPPQVRGLINLRGEIVTAIDLRSRMGMEPIPLDAERPPMNVIIREAEGTVSFLVDKIGDVLMLGTDTFEPNPPTLQDEVRELINGVHKLPDCLMLVLDTDKTMWAEA